jgi:hypothetical protein
MDKVAAQAGAGLRAPLQPFIFEYAFCPCTLVAILEYEAGGRTTARLVRVSDREKQGSLELSIIIRVH